MTLRLKVLASAALLSLLLGLTPALAASRALSDGITLSLPGPSKTGQTITIGATLRSGAVPIPNVNIHFLINGVPQRQIRTDASGTARFALRGQPAGSYRVTAQYLGDFRVGSLYRLQPTASSATLSILPDSLVIRTVPPVAGLKFALDSHAYFVTDANGVAQTNVAVAGYHTLSVDTGSASGSTQVAFERWSDNAFLPSRALRVDQDILLYAGLRVKYLTTIRFVDTDGHPVDPARVSGVSLAGPNGETVELQPPYPPIWLQSAVPTQSPDAAGFHLNSTPYSVMTGSYDSLSVINRGQQKYLPGSNSSAVWTIRLLLYSVQIRAQDAILGFGLKREVRVTDSLDYSRSVTLNQSGVGRLVAPRGQYVVRVLGDGIGPLTPVALSRSQTVTIPVITPLDMALMSAAGFLIVASLIVVARGRRLRINELWHRGARLAIRSRSARSGST